MRALVLRSPENLELMDVPKPAAGPGQVLVRVHRCGICGSDLRYLAGENPWASGVSAALATPRRDIPVFVPHGMRNASGRAGRPVALLACLAWGRRGLSPRIKSIRAV
jgi:NADPH:quinone reductase-like Zn-dependent oxidoreductase